MTTARRPVARAEHEVRMHGVSVLLSDVAAEGEHRLVAYAKAR
jgi:hypothetical protein